MPGSSPNGSYTVSWGAVATASGYTVQESVNGGGWSTVQSGSATSWGTSGRGDGSYAYRVQACNASGCGPWSGTGTVNVLLPPPAPAYVNAPSSVPYPGNSWGVYWVVASTATSYTLQRINTGTNAVATVYNGGGTSANDYAVPGTYRYQVQACNASGCSGWTSSESMTVFCAEGAAAAKANGVQPLILKCN